MTKHKIAQYSIQSQQDIQFYYTGTEQCIAGQSWGPAIKQCYKIFYIHSGKGIYRTVDRTYHLSKGHVFLLSPYVVSFFQADGEEPWNFSWVAFGGGIVKDYLRQAGFTPENPVISSDREQEIRQCFNRLFDANQRYYSKPLQLTSALYAFLALVLESSENEPAILQNSNIKDVYVAQAISFMKNNYTRNITIEEMAQTLGLNRKYLASLFKAAMGMPPQHYLGELRLSKACGLLTDTSLSIKEIAYSVGYTGQLHFTRMFKKMYGISPSQYRDSGHGIGAGPCEERTM
ncbi:helix-turn-helix domain-containing protein [Paenibacillus thalictri]|uniref:AraC family transcriptional regulator n=1 Tax=Paenibacillus thalictri TaxID=2527873 RepID=A0A4Q9DHF2_9BACL|nr:AraC family transcriptional regulator [Paenibacillus thalictri]TBL70283.1 AraC family transcriptional regulator [Paenibacillus thalictri]